MKSILLATTALGILVAGAAHAEGPVVTVGGFADLKDYHGFNKALLLVSGAFLE